MVRLLVFLWIVSCGREDPAFKETVIGPAASDEPAESHTDSKNLKPESEGSIHSDSQGEDQPSPLETTKPQVSLPPLAWHFPSDQDHYEPQFKEPDLLGGGVHQVGFADFKERSLNLSGDTKSPPKASRDVLIAVDVSGSMKENDGDLPTSCERYEAVMQVADNLMREGNRIAVLTFSTGVLFQTDQFYGDFTAFRRSFGSFAKMILCRASGGTHYEKALSRAFRVLKTSDSALKELILVSDGQPEDKIEPIRHTAQEIRDADITVGTLMLKGTDDVMRDHIASRDHLNHPLHFKIEDSSQLLGQLARLTSNQVVGTTVTVSYRDKVLQRSFNPGPFIWTDVVRLEEQADIIVTIQYWDRRNYTVQKRGEIKFQP